MLKFTILILGLISSVVTILGGKAIAQVPIEPNNSDNSVIIPNRPSTQPNNQPNGVILTNPTGTIVSEQRFSCQLQSGQYTVMYQPKSQPGQFYAWAIPSVMGGGWSSQRRCSEISRRLEQYRPDGLAELQTGTENGYSVICATTDRNPTCRIVLTVPVGADPNNIRDRVFGNLTTADSGQRTLRVNTYVQGNRSSLGALGGLLSIPVSGARSSFRNDGIELKPFLDRADGGTGTELSMSRGLRFRPNQF
ncbi:hypothetical protein Syn7502_00321 [Synechococcus sp. PCC 7502]|uniref:COP23 domain-containing protein n=1 Tax=Synechococcus sp. PCC 7502 TaxID=1173263 RepID=UPI00029F87A2|nr:COP23 domain-containing protein [Synechococcus sp. PCC 7502]AFY72487.1 hypothetical protein Syn7502_00321 [Synechococcus sp. PCC 7502]